MIYLDDRAGSGYLEPMLRARGIQVTMTRLPAADVKIMGDGPGGAAVNVGVEVKTIGDFVSSWHTGRLAGTQLPKMQRLYYQAWLLVIGDVEDAAYTMMASEYEGYMISMRTIGGLLVKEVRGSGRAADWLKTLHGWWTGKDYDQHRAHIAIDRSARQLVPLRNPKRDFYARIPGVGWMKAEELLRLFPVVDQLVGADRGGIARAQGIGKTMADRIWRFLHER